MTPEKCLDITKDIVTECSKQLEQQLIVMVRTATDNLTTAVTKNITNMVNDVKEDEYFTRADEIKLTGCVDVACISPDEFLVFHSRGPSAEWIWITNFGRGMYYTSEGYFGLKDNHIVRQGGMHAYNTFSLYPKGKVIHVTKAFIGKLNNTMSGNEIKAALLGYTSRNPLSAEKYEIWKMKTHAEACHKQTAAIHDSIIKNKDELKKAQDDLQKKRELFEAEKKSFEARLRRLIDKEKTFESERKNIITDIATVVTDLSTAVDMETLESRKFMLEEITDRLKELGSNHEPPPYQ